MDNSPSPLSKHLIPNNTKYFHSETSFSERALAAAELVTTPYAIIGADDEVYLPNALNKMQKFLEDDKEYDSVGAATLAIWKYGSLVAGSWAYRKTIGYHNNKNTPIARIAHHTGHGTNPITSFFTCNLTRREILINCLKLYGVSPIVCTDALSVLMICGAGKSKYLNILYWIRNWNQSPRSHSNWNRNISIYEWWNQPNLNQAKINFERFLAEAYNKISDINNFNEAWNYCIQAENILRKEPKKMRVYLQYFNEQQWLKKIKYSLKRLTFSNKMPVTVDTIFNEFKQNNIDVDLIESRYAIEIVKNLKPYKYW